MRAVAQRVASASVEVEGKTIGEIGRGLLVYVGAAKEDVDNDVSVMAQKLVGLRIFEDEQGKMARSVADVGGSMLVISQFTLFGDVRRGRRPSFDGAAAPESANVLYEKLIARLREERVHVETGRFRAMMNVRAEVAGPVTILIDTTKLF